MKDLKKIRVIAGFTQNDIEKLTGISQTKLSLIERGYKDPSPAEREKLEKVLNKQQIQAFISEE